MGETGGAAAEYDDMSLPDESDLRDVRRAAKSAIGEIYPSRVNYVTDKDVSLEKTAKACLLGVGISPDPQRYQ